LHKEQHHDRLCQAILAHDEEFDGNSSLMVARHGDVGEARHDGGRAVGEDWKCPSSPEDTP
jgi:hypothetical protein